MLSLDKGRNCPEAQKNFFGKHNLNSSTSMLLDRKTEDKADKLGTDLIIRVPEPDIKKFRDTNRSSVTRSRAG